MKVQDAMAKTVSSASKTDTIEKIAKLMKKEDTGFIPITEGESLVGVITDRDIVIKCVAEGHSLAGETAEHIMSRNPRTISPQDDLEKAAQAMEDQEIRRLPVVEGGRLVGVLSHGNLVQALKGQGAAKEATVGVTRGA